MNKEAKLYNALRLAYSEVYKNCVPFSVRVETVAFTDCFEVLLDDYKENGNLDSSIKELQMIDGLEESKEWLISAQKHLEVV